MFVKISHGGGIVKVANPFRAVSHLPDGAARRWTCGKVGRGPLLKVLRFLPTAHSQPSHGLARTVADDAAAAAAAGAGLRAPLPCERRQDSGDGLQHGVAAAAAAAYVRSGCGSTLANNKYKTNLDATRQNIVRVIGLN